MRDLRARGDAVEPVAVLVDIDRDRRASLQRPAALVPSPQRLLAVLDPELAQLRQRLERLVERPPLVDVDLERQLGDSSDGADAVDVEPVGAAELELEARRTAAPPSPPGAPCRRDRRARRSTTSAGRSAASRAASRRGRRAALPAGRAEHRRARPSPRSRRAAAGPRSAPAQRGRRRARPRPPRGTRARTRPTRRSARSAPPRRSRWRRRGGARPGRRPPRRSTRARSRTSPPGAGSRSVPSAPPASTLTARRLQKRFAPPNLWTASRHEGGEHEAIDRPRDRSAGGACRHGIAGDRGSGVRGELRRLLRLGDRRRSCVRQPRRADCEAAARPARPGT